MTEQPPTELCACGKRLHYVNPETEAYMWKQVAMHGEYVKVRSAEGAWMVPRHYMALHVVSSGGLPELARLHNWRKVTP